MIATKPRICEMPIDRLTLDKTVQLRANLNRNAILDYADAMKAGDQFPPIVVFENDAARFVSDGFHRVMAAIHLKRKTIRAEVRPGTRRDAILYAVQANRTHGVRRTQEDKRKSIITLLKDKEWRKWADTEIARACGVDPATVKKYRDWLRPEKVQTHEETRTYIDREGRERTRTVPKPTQDMEPVFRRERCPYCGQDMPKKGDAE